MSNKAANSGDYLQYLLNSWSAKSADKLSGLSQLRARAIDSVNTQRLPNKRDEEWRFTNISPLTQLAFPPSQQQSKVQASDLEPFYLPETTNRLVFVDGHYAAELSTIADAPIQMVGNLPAMMRSNASTIESHLGHYAKIDGNVFSALNTAFLRDCAVIIVPKKTVIIEPIQLLFVSTQEEVSNYPRCFVIAEQDSKLTLIEDHVSMTSASYITNTVAEICLAANAHVQHIRIQRDSQQAYHLANCAVSLAHASQYQSVSVSLGSKISRYNLEVQLSDENSECTIDGLTLIAGQQLSDTHTCIDHIKPHCTSHQQHKCIVDETAHAVFNGKIMVRPQAQQTNSSQSSRNLLLSNTAKVDTKPQLEIFADDVKCAHGATVGQLDSEEIFYLESRGLSKESARKLLTYAFAADIIHRIPVASLQQQLEKIVLNQMQGV